MGVPLFEKSKSSPAVELQEKHNAPLFEKFDRIKP